MCNTNNLSSIYRCCRRLPVLRLTSIYIFPRCIIRSDFGFPAPSKLLLQASMQTELDKRRNFITNLEPREYDLLFHFSKPYIIWYTQKTRHTYEECTKKKKTVYEMHFFLRLRIWAQQQTNNKSRYWLDCTQNCVQIVHKKKSTHYK